MSTKALYFASDLTVGLGPGVAVTVRAGEVLIDTPGPCVEALLKRPGIVEAGVDHLDARRVTCAERKVPQEIAELVSPKLDDDRLLADFSRRKAAETLRKQIEAEGGKSKAAA
jgi:hypothetical protein